MRSHAPRLPAFAVLLSIGCGDGERSNGPDTLDAIVHDAGAGDGHRQPPLPASDAGPDVTPSGNANHSETPSECDAMAPGPDPTATKPDAAPPELDATAPGRDAVVPDPDATPRGCDAMPPVPPDLTPLASGDGVALPFRVVDAEYSDALDRIILVSAEPDRLIALDPESGAFETVALPLTASSISVHPEGSSAAIGHNGYVTVVDLDPLELTGTLAVAADVFDVVLAGNGYAYAFPRVDQWVGLHSLHIETGQETASGIIRAGTVARLHPAGDRMYGADRGISPADIERYDITAGSASYAYDSPYHGNYSMCGDLWFSQDGARIFTACGNVFRASNVRADDMSYNGALEGGPGIRHLDHSSAAGLVAIVHSGGYRFPGEPPPPNVSQVSVYEAEFLNRYQTVELPGFDVAVAEYRSEGRFVFFNASGTRLYVVVEAEAAAPLINNFGLVRYTIGGEGADAGPIVP